MPKADVIRSLPDGSSECRCKTCGRIFQAGGRKPHHVWQNHYYCSQDCAIEANKCDECGGNRNFCDCRD